LVAFNAQNLRSLIRVIPRVEAQVSALTVTYSGTTR
jgi:hypothetical protein